MLLYQGLYLKNGATKSKNKSWSSVSNSIFKLSLFYLGRHNNFGSEKFLVLRKFFVPKNFLVPKNLGPNKFLVPKVLGPKKI